MKRTLKRNLYITYSNQRSRDLKSTALVKAFDEVVTLEQLIVTIFEQRFFQFMIDDILGADIIYHLIHSENIGYFSYLKQDADALRTIFDFIVKCHHNAFDFSQFIEGEKLEAVEAIDKAYQAFKKAHDLADMADVEEAVLNSWDGTLFDAYESVYVDAFDVGHISFIKSGKQKRILEKLADYPVISQESSSSENAKMISPAYEVFDAMDEVRTALKIARKLLEEGTDAEQILIVASDITEYAPLYRLFLDEYGLQGYSSMGTPLSAFHRTSEPKVANALNAYEAQVVSLEARYKKLGLSLPKESKAKLKAAVTIGDEKIGIELTEPNQLVGLQRHYEHIIFMGTDINHFPPQAKENFLYTYEDDVTYFYANDYFLSSQTQLEVLKKMADNLYIITANYSGKRELVRSILIDDNFDGTIDISGVFSASELALQGQSICSDDAMKAYFESITGKALTAYDGMGVRGVEAKHLSASQINKYLTCPLAYLYANKLKLRAPTQSEEGFDVMEQGSLMHLCYELFGKKIKAMKSRSKDKEELYTLMYETSIEAYNHKEIQTPKNKPKLQENIHHKIFLSTLQAGLQDERDKGLLAKFVDYYIERAEEFAYFQNTEFEKAFALDSDLKPYTLKDEDDNNYFIKGFIDRFDNLESKVNIIDYKSKNIDTRSGEHKETQEKIDTLKDVQLALYILYAKQAYPNKEHYAAMLSFKGKSKAAHFGELKHEHFNEAYEKQLKEIIFSTKENIENGNFGFNNSDEKACEWCDFKFICHESVLEKSSQRYDTV